MVGAVPSIPDIYSLACTKEYAFCYRRAGTRLSSLDFGPRKSEVVLKTTPELLVAVLRTNVDCECRMLVCTIYLLIGGQKEDDQALFSRKYKVSITH